MILISLTLFKYQRFKFRYYIWSICNHNCIVKNLLLLTSYEDIIEIVLPIEILMKIFENIIIVLLFTYRNIDENILIVLLFTYRNIDEDIIKIVLLFAYRNIDKDIIKIV